MNKIFLLRHGQTIWNQEKRFQGQLDSSLTPKGILQARKVSSLLNDRLTTEEITAIYSSPLGRAVETCNILVDRLGAPKQQVIKTDLLKECHYGCWQGFSRDQIENKYPGERAKREVDKWNYRIDGGESYADIFTRANRFLDKIPKSGVVIIVAHEMFNRVLRGVLNNLSNDEILKLKQPNNVLIEISNSIELLHNV